VYNPFVLDRLWANGHFGDKVPRISLRAYFMGLNNVAGFFIRGLYHVMARLWSYTVTEQANESRNSYTNWMGLVLWFGVRRRLSQLYDRPTLERAASAWTTPLPSRRKGLRPIPWRWRIMISLLTSTSSRRLRKPNILKRSSQWLLDVLMMPQRADAAKVFEVAHPDVLALFGRQQAGGTPVTYAY
jgi:hypothetical protein